MCAKRDPCLCSSHATRPGLASTQRSTNKHCIMLCIGRCLIARPADCFIRYLDSTEEGPWVDSTLQQRSTSTQRRDFLRAQSLVPLYIAGKHRPAIFLQGLSCSTVLWCVESRFLQPDERQVAEQRPTCRGVRVLDAGSTAPMCTHAPAAETLHICLTLISVCAACRAHHQFGGWLVGGGPQCEGLLGKGQLR